MRIDIITLFPELLKSPFEVSILKRALESGIAQVHFHDLRTYSTHKQKQVDDYPFGGGAGMVMMIEPIDRCLEALKKKRDYDAIIYLTPDGKTLNQKAANHYSTLNNIILLCFGSDYQQGAELLYWLFLALFFMTPNLVLTQGALAINRENYYALGACGAALLNISLNYFLIPVYGAKGAAFGTIATEAFLLVFMGYGIYSWCLKRRPSAGESQ